MTCRGWSRGFVMTAAGGRAAVGIT